jgi:hypothetical protein
MRVSGKASFEPGGTIALGQPGAARNAIFSPISVFFTGAFQ